MKEPKLNKKTVWLFALGGGLILTFGVIHSAGRKAPHRAPARVGSESHLASLPHIILWAWERPEKLEFIDS